MKLCLLEPNYRTISRPGEPYTSLQYVYTQQKAVLSIIIFPNERRGATLQNPNNATQIDTAYHPLEIQHVKLKSFMFQSLYFWIRNSKSEDSEFIGNNP